MRSDINYLDYNPANFTEDHPNDPILEDSRKKAEELSARLMDTELPGTPQEKRQAIEQQFDELQGKVWDAQQHRHLIEHKDELRDYANEKTDAIYKEAHERISESRPPEVQIASWQGVTEQVRAARKTAANDPEFHARQEQLTQFQAARSEAVSQEIHEIQQQLLKVHGLDTVEPARNEPASESIPENSMNNCLIPADVMARGEPETRTIQSFEEAMRDRIEDSRKNLQQETSKDASHSLG